MAHGPKRSLSLRQGLDRDIYHILKKLEDANDGKPFKSVPAVYDAIKRSNSSLSRQKKRPLEDAIDRVLQFRKEELADSEDSEAEIDQPEPKKPEDDRFLLNRQMTKFWNQDATPKTSSEPRPAKKRRIQGDGDERDGRSSGGEAVTASTPRANGAPQTDVPPTEKSDKAPQKKSQKSSRHKVEQLEEPLALGGLDDIGRQLLRRMRHLLKWPDLYTENTWRQVPGIILSGPPGTGKKSIVRSLAAELEVPLVSLAGCFEDPERLDRSLTEAIDEAMRLAPSIIFIEQLDWYMANPSGTGHNDHSRKVMTQFMRHMQRIEQQQPKDRPILAMATTSRITDVDPAVLKTGLFEQTIQLRIPDDDARRDIFKVVTDGTSLSENVDFAQLAKMTHGFVGADIVSVVTMAQQIVADRIMDEMDLDQLQLDRVMPDEAGSTTIEQQTESSGLSYPPPPKIPLTLSDFQAAIKGFTPSLRKEGFTVIPDVTWDQVGAMEKIREQLHMSIIGPIKDPGLYQEFGLKRPAGVLLWGPPGCGKTLVAQAVANEAQASFILINGPELLNKYVGESERAVRELFQRARSSTPCILFFDEIDSLVPRRDNASTEAGARVVNALLTELDGARDRSGIYVIGTTNRPDMIDAAMLRPGRLSVRLFVDLPTPAERADILRAIYRSSHTATPPTPAELGRLDGVAQDPRCKDFSGADLGGLHIKAAECALRRWIRKTKTARDVDAEDWEHALANTHRSVLNPEVYRRLDAKLGRAE